VVDLDVGADVDPIKQRQFKASVVMARWQHAEAEELQKSRGDGGR
jgi:hypothetical protein